MGRRGAAALVLVVGLLAGWPATAHAGGGRMAPVRERYEPGQVATLVGYTGGPLLPAVPEEPFYAYLVEPASGAEWYVGELVVEETGHPGYLHVRVSLTFEIPAGLEPGEYEVVYCDDGCTGAPLGDLGASPLSIGVDPARRVVREWALDDPEIANLDGDALLVGPGFQTTAGARRAPPSTAAPVRVEAAAAPAPLAPAPPATAAPAADGMAWPLPTALVLAGAGATALFFSRRQRAVRPRGADRRWAAFAGRG